MSLIFLISVDQLVLFCVFRAEVRTHWMKSLLQRVSGTSDPTEDHQTTVQVQLKWHPHTQHLVHLVELLRDRVMLRPPCICPRHFLPIKGGCWNGNTTHRLRIDNRGRIPSQPPLDLSNALTHRHHPVRRFLDRTFPAKLSLRQIDNYAVHLMGHVFNIAEGKLTRRTADNLVLHLKWDFQLFRLACPEQLGQLWWIHGHKRVGPSRSMSVCKINIWKETKVFIVYSIANCFYLGLYIY